MFKQGDPFSHRTGINGAKCNLGKVKLQANAVSGLLLKRT